MVPTLKIGQRILANRLISKPSVGDIVVFHPPKGADPTTNPICGNPSQGGGHDQPCDQPTADRVDPDVHQARRRRPRRPDRDRGRPRHSQRCPGEGLLHRALWRRRCVHFPAIDRRSARPLVHDGGQPWCLRRQSFLGSRPRPAGSSASPSSPTGRLTASASSKRRGAQTGGDRTARKLFAFDRSLEHRFVAGADEAGRGCLAGPLVAAARAVRPGTDHAAGRAGARAAQRLQAAFRGVPGRAVPDHHARRDEGRRHLPVCARDR